MFESGSGNMRKVGVGIPDGQRVQRGDGINILQHFVPTEMFAIQYCDESGNEHKTVVMRIAGQWYLPPNGEAWAQALKPLKSDTWLAKQLSESFGAHAAPLPRADAVDILPGKVG